MADPKVHTFAVFVPESVSIHPAKIEIEGNRKTLVKDKEDKYALAGDSVAVLSIAINGADASDVLRNLKDQLFITTVADALAQIPPQYVPGLPYKVAPDKKAAQTESSPPASCPTGRFKRAEVLHSEDAHLPDSQRASGRVSALVRLAFTIDETGHVADLWLARPAGNGFDEEAEKATAKYTFKPATCDGLPVQWGTYMDVTFGKF